MKTMVRVAVAAFTLLLCGCDALSMLVGRGRFVTYYAPVVSADDRQVAYLKRTVWVRFGRQGFGGHAPMWFRLDRLELCTARLNLWREHCPEKWELPLKKRTDWTKGEIRVQLGWRGSDVVYRIKLENFVWQCGDQPCPQTRILSNVEKTETIERRTEASFEAGLDEEPWRSPFPISNKIVIFRKEARR